jgi:hypothetical protein
MTITITQPARDKLIEVLDNPKNEGAKLRVVFEGYG